MKTRFEACPGSFRRSWRGTGRWGFATKSTLTPDELSDSRVVFWFDGSFTDAKKAATAWAKTLNVHRVFVLD